MKKVFAFDMGKASIGFCCREEDKILSAGSLIVNATHSTIDDIRTRRRTYKTLEAHKAREVFFNKLWQSTGLKILDENDDRYKIEFSSKNDETIYNSCLLRIALLQNKKLENWQIYKAIHNAFQRRGYDSNLPWRSAKTKDDEENESLTKIYTQKDGIELINNDHFKYPCYYEALLLGLWTENNPYELKRTICKNHEKIRSAGRVAPRNMVKKELTDLWIAAQKQIPELQKISVEKFLYGEYREPYASFVNSDWRQYMGKKEDWQGVLGQKIPRFNNRIIAKCKLLPKRNVCSADTIENITFVLLQQLHNFRYVNSDGEPNCRLAPYEIKEIYDNKISEWSDNLYDMKRNNKNHSFTIVKKDIEKVIGKGAINEKFEKFTVNTSGRSSFCRRAMQIMNELYLTGTEPQNLDISKFVDKNTTANPITEDEIRNMLSKIGSWNELHIPDNREEVVALAKNSNVQSDLMIGSITNPVVRNRLQIFKNLLIDLISQYGKPDEIIFEFVREGKDNSLFGAVKAKANEDYMKKNAKENEEIKKKLEDIDAYSATNFLKFKLAKMQDGKCIYSGKRIAPSDFDSCEIDHIFPRTDDGNDALYNKVICYKEENAAKSGRTPYEWLHSDTSRWQEYITRVKNLAKNLGKTKVALLTLSPEESEKFLERKNALAETAQIARVAQSMTAFILGWGLQVKGENRRIFVNNGSSTSKIRRQYNLNRFLGDDEKKNRNNDKHHALDAICISYSREFTYDTNTHKYRISNLNVNEIERVINEIIPYPYTNDKPLKSAIAPEETIYGKKVKNGIVYVTKRVAISEIKQESKSIKNISDEDIKRDLLNKAETLTSEEWQKMLTEYIHPTRNTKVKKVIVFVGSGELTHDSNGRERIGEYCDFGNKGVKGQFKKSKQHKGQIFYFNEKGTVKVMPIYSNIKLQDVKDKLINMGCKLYLNGFMFRAGILVEIPNEFVAQGQTRPAEIYKLRTIMANGGMKLEDNTGNEFIVMAPVVIQAGIKKYK